MARRRSPVTDGRRLVVALMIAAIALLAGLLVGGAPPSVRGANPPSFVAHAGLRGAPRPPGRPSRLDGAVKGYPINQVGFPVTGRRRSTVHDQGGQP